jgi:hypothetical protein
MEAQGFLRPGRTAPWSGCDCGSRIYLLRMRSHTGTLAWLEGSGDTIYGQPILEPSTNAYAILKDFYGIQVAPQAVPGLEIMECTIPSPAPGEDQVKRNSRVDHLIPSSPVSLLFLTSTAKLRIGFGSITYIPQEGTSESVCLGPFYTICSPNDTSHVIGSINLNRSWRET